MLIVLSRFPVAAPTEPIFQEETITEIVMVYFIRYIFTRASPKSPLSPTFRLDVLTADVRIVERIDVYSQTATVF